MCVCVYVCVCMYGNPPGALGTGTLARHWGGSGEYKKMSSSAERRVCMKTKRTTKSNANPKIRREAAKRMSNAEIWAQVKAERANTPNACREMLAQMLKEREAEKAVAAAAAAAATAANPVTSPVANDSGHATTGPNNAG